MKDAVRYEHDPEQDELRRPGFAAVLAQVKAERPSRSEDSQRAIAKERWHAQQEKQA